MPQNRVTSLADHNPIDIIAAYGDKREYAIPDIVEFCLSDRYLNKPSLYPRQATLLKVIFLQDELFTDYDYDVLGEWAAGFRLQQGNDESVTVHFEGDWGISPDVLTRIKMLKAEEYRWFKVILAVLGRRSGKGHIGSLCAAYVLWHYLQISNPKAHYGIDEAKRVTAQVFAGKKAQARDNQWRDIANVISSAPCFTPYFTRGIGESTTLSAPFDWVRAQEIQRRGIDVDMDLSTFEIVPKEATTMAARGPASMMQFYDEMAHMVATGVSRSAGEVWDSATPALDQFGKDAFIYCGSSPWTMDGKFYELVQLALEVNAHTLQPEAPNHLIVQLTSWDIYVDWELTKLPDPMLMAPARMKPDQLDRAGRVIHRTIPRTYFFPLKNAIQTYDDEMRRLERANPDTFKVERRSKWAAGLDTYFPLEHVRRAFHAWNGRILQMEHAGHPEVTYVAHGDPGQTGSNFAFAVGHYEADPDGHPIGHVVYDYVHAWEPGDFESKEMDYLQIEEEIGLVMDAFVPSDVSFDQWNSISLQQTLALRAREYFKPSVVWQRDATAANNWATAETYKLALSLDRIHIPYYELAELELMFLRKLPGNKVDHPTSGPVTTKDVYDVLSIVAFKLLGAQIADAYGAQFSALQIGTNLAGPQNFDPRAFKTTDNSIASAFSKLSREQLSSSRSRGPARSKPR